jgi:predicted metal-binding membrane protein
MLAMWVIVMMIGMMTPSVRRWCCCMPPSPARMPAATRQLRAARLVLAGYLLAWSAFALARRCCSGAGMGRGGDADDGRRQRG